MYLSRVPEFALFPELLDPLPSPISSPLKALMMSWSVYLQLLPFLSTKPSASKVSVPSSFKIPTFDAVDVYCDLVCQPCRFRPFVEGCLMKTKQWRVPSALNVKCTTALAKSTSLPEIGKASSTLMPSISCR